MKNVYIIGGVVIVLGAFLFWAGSVSKDSLAYWQNTEVACLPNGHQQVAFHIHPELKITVDGEEEMIPANIGVTENCMAELHTHDSTGMIHIETATVDRINSLSFADFFEVWGQSLEREGYELVASMNGSVVEDLAQIPLEDHAVIELSYSSVSEITEN